MNCQSTYTKRRHSQTPPPEEPAAKFSKICNGEHSSQNPHLNNRLFPTIIDDATPKNVEVYQVRQGTANNGIDYETKIATLFSLRFCDSSIEDFSIAVNVAGCGKFDDVIIQVQPKSSAPELYLIQIKYQKKAKIISSSQFTGPTGDYSLEEYSKNYHNLYLQTGQDKPEKLFDLLQRMRPKSRFVIFTNKIVEELPFIEYSSKENLLNAGGKMCQFLPEKLPQTLDAQFLKSFSLFSSQTSLKDAQDLITNQIRDNFQFDMDKKLLSEIVRDYTIFFSDWTKGELGNHHFLTKKKIIHKLAELLFNYFFPKFEESPQKRCGHYKTTVWQEIIQNVPGTVLIINYEEDVYRFLYQSLEELVLEPVEDKVEFLHPWREGVGDEVKEFWLEKCPQIQFDVFKSDFENVTLLDLYKTLWKSGHVHLILEVNTIQDYYVIINCLKLFKTTPKLIIVNRTSLDLSQFKLEGSVRYLSDLDQVSKLKILKEDVRFQNRDWVKFGQLLNRDQDHDSIDLRDTIRILRGSFNIGGQLKQLPDFFVERKIPKIILQVDVFKKEHISKCSDVFLVQSSCKGKTGQFLRGLAGDYLVDDRNHFDNRKFRVFLVDHFEKIPKPKSGNYHFLNFDGDNFEWVKTWGSTRYIRGFRRVDCSSVSVLGFDVFRNEVTLVSADPGMGKTIFLDSLALRAPKGFWVLRVNLNDHLGYFNEKNFASQSSESILRYFCWCSLHGENQLGRNLFERYLESKKVVVLLDGFDEISPGYKDQVTKMALDLHKNSYRLCITTRPVMRAHLENIFDTFSISLAPFSKRDQRDFLKSFFNRNSPPVLQFIDKLLEVVQNNLNDSKGDLIATPLHTKLLAEAYSERLDYFLARRNLDDLDNFDLLNLYENFIDKKVNLLIEKFGLILNVTQNYLHDSYKAFALSVIFPESVTKKLNIHHKFDRLLEDVKTAADKNGIVLTEDEISLHFVHRSFAEYFAAYWIKDHLFSTTYKNEAKHLAELLFEPEYHNVRKLFDSMLSKSSPLHKAIVNTKLDKIVLETFTTSRKSEEDSGGRTPLHLVCSWGSRFPIPQKGERIDSEKYQIYHKTEQEENLIRELSKLYDSNKQDQIFNYTPLDYSILCNNLLAANALSASSKSVNVSFPNVKGYIYYASRYDYKHLLELLCKTVDENKLKRCINHKDECGRTPLHWAVMKGHHDVVEILLKNGGDSNSPEQEYGETPLHLACKGSSVDLVKMLLKFGADANKVDGEYERNSLHCSIKEGNDDDIVEELLAARINIDAVDKYGKSYLHYAVARRKGLVRTLLEAGIDPNIVDLSGGSTALHWAASKGQLETVQILLSFGARTDLQDNDNLSPVDNARKSWSPRSGDIVKLLKQYQNVT